MRMRVITTRKDLRFSACMQSANQGLRMGGINASARRQTCASALCAALLLMHALTTAHGEPQRVADRIPAEKTRHARYLNSWAVKVGGGAEKANALAEKHGLINRGQIGNLRDHYLLTTVSGGETQETTAKELSSLALSKTAALGEDELVTFVELQQIRRREKRAYTTPTDPGWKKQWSLENTGQTQGVAGLDLNVEPVWMQGVTGQGVVVGFVDDGLEWNHKDLINNYDAGASYDFAHYDGDPTPDENLDDEPNSHGTSCAGEVAMGRNCSCGVGVAHECSIAGLKLDLGYSSDAIESDALGHQDSYIDVYSNSWGPSDFGFIVEGPGNLLMDTFSNGVKTGRGGKGSIYVWAAGNGGDYHDSCAADGYASSIYTIAVGSADQNGGQAYYDEDCSAKMAVTFSYNSDTFPGKDDTWEAYDQVYTTTLGGKCTDGFTGTSASAPLVSGVVALTLQANPDLTWRDVQYLIAYTSNPDILTGDDWVTNDAGLRVSLHFGFGAIDAEAMVTRARHWTNVPEQHEQTFYPNSQSGFIYNTDIRTITVNEDNLPAHYHSVGFLEHVVVTMSLTIHGFTKGYESSDFYDELYDAIYDDNIDDIYTWMENRHPRRGDIEIELTSPSGTRSVLLPYRDYDFVNEEGYDNWPFMSVHFWGENPNGTWTLKITYRSGSGYVSIRGISMAIYGSETTPTAVSSIPSTCHPSCVRGCSGGGPNDCDVCKNLRLSSTLECVDVCPNGTRVYKSYCMPVSDTETDSQECSSNESHILAIAIGSGVAVGALLILAAAVSVVMVVCLRKRKRRVEGFRRLQTATDIKT